MEKVTIYLMGKAYEVPRGLTIMRAMEYAGYQLIRGAGCRGGFCGSCGTVYRTRDSYRLKVGLACQTTIEDGMSLAQIPFFPANKALYEITELTPSGETLLAFYPEMMRCVSCNTCTKACPQNLKVMDYVNAALRGDLAKAADLSFDCIMCGLCAARCPGELVQHHIGILARRLYARGQVARAPHLRMRLEEIRSGKFDQPISELMRMPLEGLKPLYAGRDIEPE